VFDHCGNHVEEGTELIVRIVGLSFVDKHGPARKVIFCFELYFVALVNVYFNHLNINQNGVRCSVTLLK
jgi:hypothetical protein